jgi:hypothetical protein
MENSNEYTEKSELLVTDTDMVVIFIWRYLQQNLQVMETLDMSTNSMCRVIKVNNPTLRDDFVQARVLTFLFMTCVMMSHRSEQVII